MPLEQEIEQFPTHAYLDKEKYKDLDRENKIKLREGLFGYFIQQDPARAQEFMSLPSDEERLSVRDAFVAKVTKEVPDLFSVQVKKPQPAQGGRLSSAPGFGPAGTMFQGEQQREQKEVRSGLRDSATEMALDMIVDGEMDPSELDFEGAAIMGQFLEERGHTEKSKEVRNYLKEIAEKEGVDPRGGLGAFLSGAIVEPAREMLAGLGAVGTGGGFVIDEASREREEQREERLEQVRLGETEEQRAIREEAFPGEERLATTGAVAGLLATTVAGYVGLSKQGITHFLRRVPESRKYAFNFEGIGKGAFIEGMAGAAYSERLPGFAAEMMDQPDNKLLTALEVAALGSLFNIGVDAIRLAVRGARTGRAVKDWAAENLTEEHKAWLRAKGADVDDMVRSAEQAAADLDSGINKAMKPTQEGNRPWQMTRTEFAERGYVPGTSDELIVEKMGTDKADEILGRYQERYPELQGVQIGGWRATKKSGPVKDAGVARIIFDEDGNFVPEESIIHLSPEASPTTVRHEIEHLLDVIHGRKDVAVQDRFSRFQHEIFASDYSHRQIVKEAIRRGEEIPDKVAKEYPDLINESTKVGPSPSRTLSDAQHSIVSYEGYTGTLTELEDGTIAVRTGEQLTPEDGVIVYRSEEPGVPVGNPSEKPQGLYVAPEGSSLGDELGGKRKQFLFTGRNTLDVSDDYRIGGFGRSRESIPASAGIKAARNILGEDTLLRLRDMSHADRMEWFTGNYPDVKWGRYYDDWERIEAVAGIEGRKRGLYGFVDVDEYVVLNDQSLSRVGEERLKDIVIEGAGKDWSRTLEDLNVVEVDPYNPRSVTVGENAIKIGDSEFQRPSDLSGVMNTDADGNIISLNLRAMDGSPRTIRTPVEVEQLADVLLDRQIVQSGRAPEILRNLPEPDQNNTRAVRSREFLRNLSKRVNPTSHSVTEAIDVGESVLPDGRLVGGTDDFGRQYKSTLSKRNLRIAKNNIENILKEVQGNKDLRPTRKTKLIRDLEHKLGAIELYEQGKLFPSGVRVGRSDSPVGLEAIREIEGDLTEGAFDAIQRGDFETVATKDLRAAARQVGVRSPSRLRKPELIESLEEALTTPVRSQDAPPIRGWPEPDDTPVQPKSARVEPNDQDFRYTIFRAQTHQGIEIPGGIQIDDMVVPGRITSIDQAHAQGIDLPQPPEWLPQGRYSLGEIRRAIREGPPEMSPGALPDESTIGASQLDDDVAKLEKRVKSRIGDAPPKRAARETARPTATDEVVEEVVEQEKQAKGTQQATNPDGSNAGEVMNGEPSHAAVASGDETAWRTMQNRRKTLDSRLGIVGMDVKKWLRFMRGWNNFFFHHGSLPKKEIGLIYEKSTNAQAAMIKQQERLGKDLIKSIREAVKKTDWGEDELRVAIQEYNKGLRSIDTLPEQVVDAATRNRKFISGNAMRLIDEDIVRDSMKATVLDTHDRYMTRAYRAFTQPEDWADNIPPETRQRAIEWIQYNWRDYQLEQKYIKRLEDYNKKIEKWEENARKARAEGKAEPEYPSIRRPQRDPNYVPPALTEEQATIIADDLIDPNKGGPFFSGTKGSGGQILGKDIGVLMRRKDVPLPIRELLGEITDPVEASLQTTMRHADLIENHKAQVSIRDFGLETGLFSRKRTPAQFYHMGSNQPTAAQQQKINALVDQYGEVEAQPYIEEFMRQENGRYDVWDGLFARQDVFNDFQAWHEWQKPVRGGMSAIYRGVLKGIAGAKFTKTILNWPRGHLTNLIGAVKNVVSQGHIDPRHWLGGIQGVLRESYGFGPNSFDPLIQKLTRHGLLNQTISKRDIEQSLAFMRDNEMKGKGWLPIKELIRQWKVPDDMAKFVSWLGEEARYKGLRAKMGEEEFEKFIASRVGATQQMYDRVPEPLKVFSRHEMGVVNFVSFPYDQARIAVNTHVIIAQDMGRALKAWRAGDTVTQNAYAKAAAQRAAAFGVFGWGGGEAAMYYYNSRSNVDKDDYDFLTPWVAPYFRNETIAFTKDPRETGIVSPQVLSYNWPHETWMAIIRNGVRAWEDPDRSPEEEIFNDVKDMFFGQGMMTGRLAQAMSGYDEYGRKIPGGFIGGTEHFVGVFNPGMATQMRNISKAMSDEEGSYGRVYSQEEVILGAFGQRRYAVEVEKAVPDNFRYTWEAYREAETEYKYTQRRDNVSKLSLWRQRGISNRVREQNFRHMRNMIESLEEYFDYPRYQVDEWLREHARMSNSEIRYVRSGEYQPLEPSEEAATE